MSRTPTGTKGGPQTPAGKAITSRNALSHGLTSVRPVIPGLESAEDWEAHRTGVLASLLPEGHLETNLAERIATLLWRIQRVVRFESETVSLSQAVDESVPPGQATMEDMKITQEWHPVNAVEPIFPISWAGLVYFVVQLPRFPAHTEINGNSARALLLGIIRHADGHNQNELLAAAIPQGITPGANWTADKLRDAVQKIAECAHTTPESLLLAVRAEAEAKAEQKRQADLATTRRSRILPDSSDLDKIMRYEAHLNRLLLSTFHELEALQERRLGHPAPLARIDITTDTQS